MVLDVPPRHSVRSFEDRQERFPDLSQADDEPGSEQLPRVPAVAEMARLLEKAAAVIPRQNLWVNPDCGLKTRGWPETEAALRNMVQAAKLARQASPPPSHRYISPAAPRC